LAVGAISEPYETHYGVEIVRRIPNRERPTYAAEMIKHSYDPASATSKREAYELARRSIEILKRTPERFNELEHTYCCSEPQRWVDGRDQLGLTPIAKTLEVGEFRGEPVEHMASWAVVKRMEPSRITQFQAPTPRFEVPAPERPSLSWALATLPPPLIAREIVALAKEHPGVATSERERELFQEIAQQTNADAAPARAEADPARLVLSVRELFQSENRAHYRALLEERLGDAMMRAQLDG
jgi:hypothetical protein